MSRFEENVAILFEAWDSRQELPSSLLGRFTDDDGYRAQVMMLERRLASGARQAGWKVGQTNRRMREERGEQQPAPGFLLEQDKHDSGFTLDLAGMSNWHIEPELALVLASPLAGPGVTEVQAVAAIGALAPALELVQPKGTRAERTLLRAVNGATSGFVLGDSVVMELMTPARLDELSIELWCDGKLHSSARGGEVNDNPIQTLVWLANYLGGLGHRLEAGFVILAGSYAGLVPVETGQHWRAVIGEVGVVEMRTA